MSGSDSFVRGMSAWNEDDDAVLDRYRLWQLDLISPYLGRTVLEVGAGNGRFALAAHRQGRSFDRYLALEPGAHFFAGLEKVQHAIPHFTVENAVIDALPAACTGAFDTVLSIHVMEHVEDDEAFLRDCLDKASPDGYVVVLVPALNALYSDLDRKIGHYRRYDKPMMRDLARRAGGELLVNRYDNLIGVLGWYWICKVRGIDYHTDENKSALKGSFGFFSRYVLPITSAIERIVSPPIGLNLTAVLRRRATITAR
jgi:SAM-dependent methyltransferase